MARSLNFLNSMAGRFFVVLLVGVAASACIALALADMKRRADLDRLDLERAADQMQGFTASANAAEPDRRQDLLARGTPGVHLAPADVRPIEPDAELTRLLRARLDPAAQPTAQKLAIEACRPPRGPGGPEFDGRGFGGRGFGGRGFDSQGFEGRGFDGRGPDGRGPQGGPGFQPSDCWLVEVRLDDGSTQRLTLGSRPRFVGRSPSLDPVFLGMLALGAALLAFYLARSAAAPLHHLSRAATELGRDLDRQPLTESGPAEVAAAAQAFNAMQKRIKGHLAERTHMLAAITHDLQTPITRLRLRLEKVADAELRERLISDLAAMQALIREGLDLARSSESAEQRARLDLDSLLQSLVEDEADAGREVSFTGGCGCDVQVQPGALKRCVSNLMDNAIAYGGSAEVSAERSGKDVVVRVRDHGPGLPEDQLEAVFDPLVRLETSRSRETGGAGLGLTIARTLAEKNGGSLHLRNHPDGGAEAVLTLPARA